MHPGLNGSLAVNDTIILDSKKHKVTGINSLVACVACFMIMSAHCGSEHRQSALTHVCVCVCVHACVCFHKSGHVYSQHHVCSRQHKMS